MASREQYNEDSRPGEAAVDSAPVLLAIPVGQFTSPPIAVWSACVEWATLLLVLLLIFRFAGLLSRISGLPTITLYLLTGAGCFQAGGVKHGTVAQLLPFHHATLAVITLAAGSELAMEQLRTHAKTIRCLTITLTIAAITIVFWLSLAVITQSHALGADAGMPVTGVASMFAAVIAIARSPSSAIAIVSEQRADGPFTQTVLSVTMVTDVVVIVLFTASLELAQVVLSPTSAGLGRLLLRFSSRTAATLVLSLGHGAVLTALCLLTLRLAPTPAVLRPVALLLVGAYAFGAEALLHSAAEGSVLSDHMQVWCSRWRVSSCAGR